MQLKLYELADAYRRAQARLDEADTSEDGAPDDLMKEVFGTIEAAIEDKVEACIIIAKEAEGEAEALKVEEERLAKRRKALENRSTRLREYVRDSLVVAGLQKLRTKLFSFTVNKPRPSVVVDEIELVPLGFVRTKKEADKAAIKTYLEEGGFIPGVHLDPGKPSLTVK